MADTRFYLSLVLEVVNPVCMRNKTTTIRILSIDVCRCSAAHQIALETAFSTNVDILLVQEQYIHKDLQRGISRNHPSFEFFSPIEYWTLRPRVLTYVRKTNGLIYNQERASHVDHAGRRDVLFFYLHSSYHSFISIINIYNAPPGATNPGAGVMSLLSLSACHYLKNCILAGDFNLHHHHWQPSYAGSSSPQAETLIDWLETKNISYISEIDKPAHTRGNVLDLCFASNSLFYEGSIADVQQVFDFTSDHVALLITVLCIHQNRVQYLICIME